MISQELSDGLIHILDKLGLVTEHVFDIFINAHAMLGLISIISICVALLCACAIAMYVRCMIISDTSSDEPAVAVFVPPLVGVFVFFIVYCALNCIVGPAVLQITCPEYTAAKELIVLSKP